MLYVCFKGTSSSSEPEVSPACLSTSITLVGGNYTYSSTSLLFREKPRLLDAFDDEYGGVVVNSEKLPFDPNVFASILKSSLSIWKTQVKFNPKFLFPIYILYVFSITMYNVYSFV